MADTRTPLYPAPSADGVRAVAGRAVAVGDVLHLDGETVGVPVVSVQPHGAVTWVRRAGEVAGLTLNASDGVWVS